MIADEPIAGCNSMSTEKPNPPQGLGITVPVTEYAVKFGEITSEVLFGDIWERPELSRRDRSLVTVSALVALYRQNELPFHFKRAIENGLTEAEVIEAITHLAFYAGWPCAATALTIAQKVYGVKSED
ncbi:4-carboxymuconolactone decarboxylase [Hydrogenophaga palleronii]|uniref:4-carboxymuconolactone decarboxylase n=1 Tax=Hydrogenophaga palleronii TaxID=65655 RepID=A0ABU1WP84_9BURK|nr:carboxymuconolactone decarboxylase family protein [Hydrogenophaga palleronii]MDR7151068.1 4-carboxymuconolactone decarboxylase [Hydrogenophaga palleronii]